MADPKLRRTLLQERIAELIEHHGSLRAAARVVMLDPGYLSRLQSGEKDDPGDTLLRRLKLRRVVTYERADGVAPSQAPTPPNGPTEPTKAQVAACIRAMYDASHGDFDATHGEALEVCRAVLADGVAIPDPAEKLGRCAWGCLSYGQCKANMQGMPSMCAAPGVAIPDGGQKNG